MFTSGPKKTEPQPSCPHAVAVWYNRPPKKGSYYPDGNQRTRHVGGALVRGVAACTHRAGHEGPHQSPGGRTWS